MWIIEFIASNYIFKCSNKNIYILPNMIMNSNRFHIKKINFYVNRIIKWLHATHFVFLAKINKK